MIPATPELIYFEGHSRTAMSYLEWMISRFGNEQARSKKKKLKEANKAKKRPRAFPLSVSPTTKNVWPQKNAVRGC